MTEPSDPRLPAKPSPSVRQRREFARSFESLEQIYGFIEPVFAAHGLVVADTYAIIMAIEELFTNMVKYNATGTGLIGLELECDEKQVICCLSDPDSERFDMSQAPDVDIDRPVEQRQPGGLGLHLIRRMVDQLDYEYLGRCSRVCFVKKRRGELLAGSANP